MTKEGRYATWTKSSESEWHEGKDEKGAGNVHKVRDQQYSLCQLINTNFWMMGSCLSVCSRVSFGGPRWSMAPY